MTTDHDDKPLEAKPVARRKLKPNKHRTKPNRPYPKIILSRAMEVAQKIKDKNGGNAWPPSDVARAMGVGGRTTDYYYVTAAARDFGLTLGTRETETIGLTDLGRQIVYAPNPEVEHIKKMEAFHKVELFSKVLKHYKGANL